MKLTPTKILHYGLLLIAAYIVYSWLSKGGGRDSYENHPRNKAKFKDGGQEVKGKGHKYADDVRHVQGEDDVDDDVDDDLRSQERYKQQRQKEYVRNNIKHEVKKDTEKKREDNLVRDKKREENFVGDNEREENLVRDNDRDDNLVIDELVKDTKVEKPHRDYVKSDSVEKDTKKDEFENVHELKLKRKDSAGEDILKQINDAELDGDPDVHKQIDKLSDHIQVKIPKLQKEWHEDHDDLETTAEKVRRRKEFFEKVRKMESSNQMQEDKHIAETSNYFPFVTAAYSEIFKGTLAFIHSVQNNFPGAEIGVMDIGLSKDEVDYLNTLCKVEVVPNFLHLYPEFIRKNMAQKLWRPIILQLAMNKYGHCVYLDPNRYLKGGADLRGHYDLSRRGGAAMFGHVKGYSSVVVTNPEMYYYLAINVRKLLKLQHMEINMMVLHSSEHIRHFFTRWLLTCATEEYCISPPGSKRKCDQNLYPKSHRYADCHRYDESAINLLLASWHKYDYDHYAAPDYVTKPYDGRDVRKYLKICNKNVKEGL